MVDLLREGKLPQRGLRAPGRGEPRRLPRQPLRALLSIAPSPPPGNRPWISLRLLESLGVDTASHHGADLVARSPIDGSELASLRADDAASIDAKLGAAQRGVPRTWRDCSGAAPRRAGAPVRRGAARDNKEPLGRLVTIEAGKILQEGPGRSAGDDRHLRLRRRPVAPALRPDDRVRAARPPDDGDLASARASSAVISAFNFPVAVWAWNAALALRLRRRRSSGSRRRRRRSPRSRARRCSSARARQAGGVPAGLSQVVLGVRDAGECAGRGSRASRSCPPPAATRMGRAVAALRRAAAWRARCSSWAATTR